MRVFVNGAQVRELGIELRPSDEVQFIQALSGGQERIVKHASLRDDLVAVFATVSGLRMRTPQAGSRAALFLGHVQILKATT
jgi:molybdopterin converting factor small subunit